MASQDKITKLRISSYSKESVQEGIDESIEKGFTLKGGISISTRKGVFYYTARLTKE